MSRQARRMPRRSREAGVRDEPGVYSLRGRSTPQRDPRVWLEDALQQALGANYTIERELGGGGMSRVFVAHDQSLDRKVVVKVMAPEIAGPLSAERFKLDRAE